LPDGQVTEADVDEALEDAVGGRRAGRAIAEERRRLARRHRQHRADVAPTEVVVEDRGLEPRALALLACRGDPGHHRQVGVDHTDAVAVRAGAPAELALNSAGFTLWPWRTPCDRVQQPGVGRRVRPGASPGSASGRSPRPVAGGDRSVHERALAGAGDTGDDDQHAERDVDVDVAQVVLAGAADREHTAGRAPPASAGDGRRGGDR
jgi:hypothetical protein